MTAFIVSSGQRVLFSFLAAVFPLLFLSFLPVAVWGADQESLTKAPVFSAKDLSGKTVKLSDLLNKGPVLINFWMSCCKPCKNQLPELDKLHRAYRDRGFQVVAISEDGPKTVLGVKALVSQKKWEMLVLVDTNKGVGNLYNVRKYPTSYLIAQDGTIAHFALGYMPGDEKQLEERVVSLLGGETRTTSGAPHGSGMSK